MAAGASSALIACLCVLLLPAASGFQLEDRECVFTDPLHQQGTGSHGGPANELREVVRENSTIRCSRGSRCYGLWERRPDGEIHLLKQGCWTHTSDQQECHGDRCLVSATPSQIQNSSYRFCCCNRNLCNTNFTEDPPALRLKKTDGRDSRHTDYQSLRWKETVFIALVTVAIAAVLIVVLFLGYRIMKGKQKHKLPAPDVMEAVDTESPVDLDKLELLEWMECRGLPVAEEDHEMQLKAQK